MLFISISCFTTVHFGELQTPKVEYDKLLEMFFHVVLVIWNRFVCKKNSGSKESGESFQKKCKFTERCLLGLVKINLVTLKGSSENLSQWVFMSSYRWLFLRSVWQSLKTVTKFFKSEFFKKNTLIYFLNSWEPVLSSTIKKANRSVKLPCCSIVLTLPDW